MVGGAVVAAGGFDVGGGAKFLAGGGVEGGGGGGMGSLEEAEGEVLEREASRVSRDPSPSNGL
jgi:hypothetical protein